MRAQNRRHRVKHPSIVWTHVPKTPLMELDRDDLNAQNDESDKKKKREWLLLLLALLIFLGGGAYWYSQHSLAPLPAEAPVLAPPPPPPQVPPPATGPLPPTPLPKAEPSFGHELTPTAAPVPAPSAEPTFGPEVTPLPQKPPVEPLTTEAFQDKPEEPIPAPVAARTVTPKESPPKKVAATIFRGRPAFSRDSSDQEHVTRAFEDKADPEAKLARAPASVVHIEDHAPIPGATPSPTAAAPLVTPTLTPMPTTPSTLPSPPAPEATETPVAPVAPRVVLNPLRNLVDDDLGFSFGLGSGAGIQAFQQSGALGSGSGSVAVLPTLDTRLAYTTEEWSVEADFSTYGNSYGTISDEYTHLQGLKFPSYALLVGYGMFRLGILEKSLPVFLFEQDQTLTWNVAHATSLIAGLHLSRTQQDSAYPFTLFGDLRVGYVLGTSLEIEGLSSSHSRGGNFALMVGAKKALFDVHTSPPHLDLGLKLQMNYANLDFDVPINGTPTKVVQNVEEYLATVFLEMRL